MVVDSKYEYYAFEHTMPPSKPLEAIEEVSRKQDNGHMVSGRIESALLQMLIHLSQAKDVLDIGMYTGYSALSMAQAVPQNGTVVALESNPQRELQAKEFFSSSEHGNKIKIIMGAALDSLEKFSESSFDLIFIDADKGNYINYYEKSLFLLRKGGVIVLDNMLWQGTVLATSDVSSGKVDQLNKIITSDSRVDNVFLTVRDGIHLVRKK
jgi:caffeoyl-CoA O-methyltransferase